MALPPSRSQRPKGQPTAQLLHRLCALTGLKYALKQNCFCQVARASRLAQGFPHEPEGRI